MAIFVPGKRDRHNRPSHRKGRSAVAMLSLTAMVDMFTVLAVFLLQNYNVTGQVIELEDSVPLPKASEVKELKPAFVVVVSKQTIKLDREVVANFNDVREQQDWIVKNLFNRLQDEFKKKEQEKAAKANALKQAVDQAKQGGAGEPAEEDPNADRRITVQADKTVDFLTIKKIMMTLTEAGAYEINFAVMKGDKAPAAMTN